MRNQSLNKVLGWVGPARGNKDEAPSNSESVRVRRSTRVPLAVSVTISSSDQSGPGFKENTGTIDVSKHGARILTLRALKPGTTLEIAKPAAGKTYLAKVLWQSRKRGPTEPIETGIEILEAFDAKGFWGVTSPPDDWKNSVAGDAAQRLEYLCARDRANPTNSALGADGPEQAPSPAGLPVVPLPRVASGPAAEKDPWLADLMAAKEKIRSSSQPWTTRQTGQEAAPGTQTRGEDSVVSPLHFTAEEVHTRLQATRQGRQEMTAGLEANSSDYQQRLGELADAALETLGSKSQALLEDFQARLESTIESLERKDAQQVADQLQRIATDLEEQSSRHLQSQADDTSKRWSEEIEVSGAVLVDEAKDQLANLTQVSLGSISQEAQAATEECRKQIARSFEEQAVTVSGATEVSVTSVRRATEEAVAELQATRQKAESSFEASASDYQRRLAELAASGLEGLESKSGALLEGFQGQLEKTLEGFEQKGAQQIADQLQKIAAGLQEQSSRQLEQQADATVQRLSEELQVSGTVLVDEARDQLANLTQASLGSIGQEAQAATEECRKQLAQSFEAQNATVSGAAEVSVTSVRRATEEAVAELQATRQKAESSFEASASDYQRRLAELAASGLEGLESKSGALLEGFQGQLEKTLEGFEQKGAQQVADQLQKIAAGLQEQSSRQLEQQADATVQRLSEELQASGAVLVDEAKDQLANLTQVSLGSIGQEAQAATEECRKQLAQSFEEQAATVSGATEVSVTSVRRATEEAVAELQATRQKAESSFEASASDYQRRLAVLAASGLEGLESKSGALLEGFQGQLEKTLEGFEQKGAQQVADQLQKIAAGLQEQSSSQLEQQADATVQRLSEELQASGTVLVDEAKDQLANLTQGSLRLLSKEAETTIAQCRSKLLQSFQDQSQAVSGDTEAAASSIRRAAEEAAAGFEATRLETEKTFRTDLAGCMEWLEEQAGAVLDGVRRKSDALLESFEGYRIQLDQSFQEQDTRVAGSADTAVSSILSATRGAATDLQAIRQEMETNFKSSVGGYQKQLAELAGSGLERLEQKSVALLAGFQGRLHNTLEGFQQKGTSEVADQLQKIAAELQEQSTGQLQEQANDTVKRLSDDLRVSGAVLLGNAREELLGLTQASLKSLAEEAQGITGSALEAAISVDRAADEAAAGLEAVRQQAEVSLENNVVAYQKRLAELAGEGAQELERKSVAFLEGFEERSGQMAQAFLEKSATLKDSADAAANSIHQAAQQAATEFEAAHREMESRFGLGSAEYEKRLTELVASGLNGLQGKSDSLVETLEEQRDQLAQTFGHQAASLSGSTDAAVDSVRLAAQEALAGWQVVRREMEIRSESGAADHQKRLTEVAASGLAGLEIKSEALLKDFEEKGSQLARTFEEQGQAISGGAGAALVSIRQAAEESATEFLLIQQSAERSFEANAGAYHKRVADVAASGVEGLESKSEALLEAFQGELQKTLETSVEKGTAEATDQLLKIAEGLQQDSIRQLREQADDTVNRLTDQLRVSGAGLVDQAREQVSSVIQTSLDSLGQSAGAECRAQAAQALQEQAATVFQNTEAAATSIRLATQEAVAELQETRQETEAGLGLSVDEHQRRLAEMAGSELEGLQQKSNALLHSSKAQLHHAIEGLQQKAASELKDVLQKIGAEFEEQSIARLRKQAAEVGATLRQDLQSSGLGVVEEARQLAGITKEALESLSQVAAEGCRQKLDEFAAKSAAMQKQMEGIASSNLEKVHKVIAPVKRVTRFPLGFAVAALALVAIVPILIVAGVSSTAHPVMKLRAEAPAQFPGTSPDWSSKRRASEEQVAKAYWQVALQELPAKFDYGMTLPEEPPADFKVDPKNLPSGAKADPAARTRYWHKVRDAWGSTEAWETSDLNADGIGATLQEAAAKVRSKIPHLW